MTTTHYLLADNLSAIEPGVTHVPGAEYNAKLLRWEQWRKLCNDTAAFIANGDDKLHAEFMAACNL